MEEYVLRGMSLWNETEAYRGSCSWNKLLKLRSLAQRFVMDIDGGERWKFNGKYSAVAVYKEIKSRKEKIAWHRLL